MNTNLYSREELMKIVEIEDKTFAEWERLKLVKSVGFADDRKPIFSKSALIHIAHIKNLLELGYGVEEIQKIIRKVGLPKSDKSDLPEDQIEQYLTVGNLADKAGVSPRTIKHWEDKGIIDAEMRSEGGFRLYPKIYIYFCKLIKDLQLFGYTLEEIKVISDYFRDYQVFKADLSKFPRQIVEAQIESMLNEIDRLKEKMNSLKEGIQRWDDLVRKNRKEIINLNNLNLKRRDNSGETDNE